MWIRGPELFAGYAEAAETEAAVHRGWFRSGDLGVVDDQGWLTITGRLKDLIIRGGENISPAEVERALEAPSRHGAGRGGRRPRRRGWASGSAPSWCARSPIDVEECRRWFAELGIARFKTPEVVVQVDELPLLAGGQARPGRPEGAGRGAGRAGRTR